MSNERRPEGPKALHFVGVVIAFLCGAAFAGLAELLDAPAWGVLIAWAVGIVVGLQIASRANRRLFLS
ncbi:hypothetical protein [Nocardioides sp. Root190]|uniref:hypothetical protein n=1 Tax=Nocardioides sp. Root190 TaxID=1736488 RepID=UPI0012FAE684|nr:hypothetical protein [Nocardioides sp. Root190]